MADLAPDDHTSGVALSLLSAWLKAAPGQRALMVIANSEGQLRCIGMLQGGDKPHDTVRCAVVVEPTLSDCVVRAAEVLT